jgi:hypothetical protein
VVGLNGRLTRLERTIAPSVDAHTCRRCGLRHVRPLTLDLARRLMRVAGGKSLAAQPPAPPLCLCDLCCGEPGDRWFARRSRGLPSEGEA